VVISENTQVTRIKVARRMVVTSFENNRARDEKCSAAYFNEDD
jgi:hypothetical protein